MGKIKEDKSLFIRDAYIRYMHNIDNLLPNVKSDVLADVRRTFLESISRIEGLLILPGFFVFQVIESFEKEKPPIDEEEFRQLAEKEDLIVVDRLRWVKETAPWRGVDVDENEPDGEELLRKCVELQVQKMLNEFYYAPDSKLYPVGEGLLNSAVVMTWTALEYAAKDAWVAALNSRPKALSDLISQPKRTRGIRVNREFQLWELAQYNFDLRSGMGSILSQKFKFSTLSGILEAYREVFGANKAVEGNFDKPGLKYLECLRHLIVHRAGVVDEVFLRRTKTTKVQLGQRHPVTDQNVSDWLDDAFAAGEAILTCVEDWLGKNPE
jgi:hypothetical protein